MISIFQNDKICTQCGEESRGEIRGSWGMTIFLLLIGIVPGLVYDSWRHGKGRCVCPYCKAQSLAELNSPIGRKLQRELQ